jgi:hypothetical protein
MNLHYSIEFSLKKGPCKLDSQLHGPQEMLMAMGGRLLSGLEPYALSWVKLAQRFSY